MVLLAVLKTELEQNLQSKDVIGDESYVICLANSRDDEVIFATKIDTELAVLGNFKLGVVKNFVEVTGVLSSLLYAPSV